MRSINGLAVGALAAAGLLFVVQPVRAADPGVSGDVGAGVESKVKAEPSADSSAKTAKSEHPHHATHHRHRKSPDAASSSTEGKAGVSGGLKTPAGSAGVNAGAGVGADTDSAK